VVDDNVRKRIAKLEMVFQEVTLNLSNLEEELAPITNDETDCMAVVKCRLDSAKFNLKQIL